MIEKLLETKKQEIKQAEYQLQVWRDRIIGLAAQIDLLSEILQEEKMGSNGSNVFPCSPQPQISDAPKQETFDAAKELNIEQLQRVPEALVPAH